MASSSSYKNFFELSRAEYEGVSYRREVANRTSRFAIIAPHGGGIEPGTSEITKAIAGTQHSYYTFDGIQQEGNERLHVTSTLFDDPKCLQIVHDSEIVIAVHGCTGDGKFIYAGGLHYQLKVILTTKLANAGFDAHLAETSYAGTQPQNICNRGGSGRGVQIEISEGLRRMMFKTFDRKGRKITTAVFQRFVGAIQSGLLSSGGGKRSL